MVFVFNLFVMGAGAWYSYQQTPPIPDGIEGPDDETVVTGSAVTDGKATFQSNGLMNHGSILGNGAYYGAEYTADALELGFTENYAASRSLEFYDSGIVQLLFWLGVPGDVLIILGALVFGYDAIAKVRKQSAAAPADRDSRQPVANRVLAEDDD